jgi:hypothetical protein
VTKLTKCELVVLLCGALALALLEQLFARISGQKEVAYTDPITQVKSGISVRTAPVPTSIWFSTSLVITIAALLGICVAALLIGRTLPWQLFRGQSASGHYLAGTAFSFLGGTLVAAGVRFYAGNVDVKDFSTGSAPLVAGLLVGVMIDGRTTKKSSQPDRQAGLLFLLVGALATAFGTIGTNGWFFGTCFFVIFGSLAASAWLVVGIVFERTRDSFETI